MLIETNSRNFNTHTQMSEETIQNWLVEQIARNVGLPPNQIDITEPFSSYGLDSVAAVGLSGELANWLDKQIPPTIMWDYPSVKLLAGYLAVEIAGVRCAAA